VSVRRGCGVLGLVLLAGCATPYADGRVALQAGRSADAARHFEDALARDPDRLDALLGLGIARYKEGKLAEAVAPLARVVARQPSSETTHLYLALAYLRGGQIPDAEAALTRLLALAPRPRLARQADRALALIRQKPAPTEEARNLLAASLEAEADAARDAQDDRFVRAGALLGTCCNMFGFDAVPTVPHRAR
jgi:tetratricopeptide (TPR) repeat protein